MLPCTELMIAELLGPACKLGLEAVCPTVAILCPIAPKQPNEVQKSWGHIPTDPSSLDPRPSLLPPPKKRRKEEKVWDSGIPPGREQECSRLLIMAL